MTNRIPMHTAVQYSKAKHYKLSNGGPVEKHTTPATPTNSSIFCACEPIEEPA